MLRLRLKPEAKSDLQIIYEYTARKWGIDQADQYQDDLFNGTRLLIEQEDLGKLYPYAKQAYRKLHVNRHLIFYRIEHQTCLVVRILHDCMDINKHLSL